MIFLNLYLKAAAATIVGTLGSSSIANMFQTISLKQNHVTNRGITHLSFGNVETEGTTTSSSATEILTLSQVKSMKRNELIQLYLSSYCYTPKDVLELKGDWDGELLDNNGVIMTTISSILTNYLFSRNRHWKGKAFLHNQKKQSKDIFTGINRFSPKIKPSPMEVEHSFDYSVTSSNLDGSPSILLRYKEYQSSISLWNTMVDELRLIEVVVDDDDSAKDDVATRSKETKSVLLGIGSMAWSGGVWNASPFLLEKME